MLLPVNTNFGVIWLKIIAAESISGTKAWCKKACLSKRKKDGDTKTSLLLWGDVIPGKKERFWNQWAN